MAIARRDSRIATILCAGAVALLTSCGAGAGSPATPSPPLSPAAESTPRPTPSPDPAAVAAERLAGLPDTFEATFEGTLNTAGTEVAAAGTYVGDGADFHVQLTTTLNGVAGTVEQINDVGANYMRHDDGDWFRTDGAIDGESSESAGRDGVLHLLAAASIADTAETGRLQRIELEDVELERVARGLGLTDENVSAVTGTVAILVDDEGTPITIELAIRATGSASDPSAVSAWDLDYTISSVGRSVVVERPSDAWRLKANGPSLYVVEYPDGWEPVQMESESDPPSEVFTSPDGDQIQLLTYHGIAGSTVAGWFDESVTILRENLGEPATTGDTTVGGLPARTYEIGLATSEGEQFFFQQAVVYADTVAWDINWWSAPGDEAADRELFSEIVGRFVPLVEPSE